jgi:DNA-binding beta-propeller fold protein YncE
MTPRAALLAVALLSVRLALAQNLSAPAIEAKPVLMFNQHLYFGGMTRPRALAFDQKTDELWVADSATGRISVHRPDGMELFSFISRQRLRDIARIAVSPAGELAVLDADRARIHRFDYRGGYAGTVDVPEEERKHVFSALAYDARGNLYAGDNASGEVLVFEDGGRLRTRFGSHGRDEGQFMAFVAIAIAPDGSIVVADQQALAVQVFDAQGNFIRGWGRHEMGAANFSLPSGLAVDGKGRVYISDELRHQVKVFNLEGTLLGSFGGLGQGFGQLSFPTDVAVDARDRVYVSERLTARVQVFELHDLQ